MKISIFTATGRIIGLDEFFFHQFPVICRRCSLDPMKIHLDLKRTEITIDLGFLVTSRRDLTDMIVFVGVAIPTNRLISG